MQLRCYEQRLVLYDGKDIIELPEINNNNLGGYTVRLDEYKPITVNASLAFWEEVVYDNVFDFEVDKISNRLSGVVVDPIGNKDIYMRSIPLLELGARILEITTAPHFTEVNLEVYPLTRIK